MGTPKFQKNLEHFSNMHVNDELASQLLSLHEQTESLRKENQGLVRQQESSLAEKEQSQREAKQQAETSSGRQKALASELEGIKSAKS
jgi:hypothetical protein